MRVGTLKSGDRIEVNLRGHIFEARFDTVADGRVWFTPEIPVGYRSCSPRQAIRKLPASERRAA